MKRLLILITISISAISLSKAQSEIKINTNDLHAEIFNELTNLPIELNGIHFDLDAMKNDINLSLAELDNMPGFIDLSGLESFSNLQDMDLKSIYVNNVQPGVNILASDSNSGNSITYAYTANSDLNNESNFSYSYTTTETPQNSDVFNQLSKIKGVDVVYISKAMLGMMPNMDMPGVDIGNIAGKLESLEIYTAENEATKRLIGISDKLIDSGNYETLMLVKDSDSRTGFYMKKGTSGKGSEMLMITEDDTDATIIRFLGNFTIQDIKNIANQGKNVNINTNINTTTNTRMSEAELNMRIKEAQKRNEEAQRIADQAQKRAIEAQKRADQAQKKAEERARAAEERAKAAEEKASKAN